ncbi:hypothetical protein [Bacillus sp. J37]|uniref:hypothetical protein n=1 Tax=Bacillus sp. J37 TaxID=935837 RepID=UPI00047D5650|nr:hypothetical protein [Bacillus sp. J37]
MGIKNIFQFKQPAFSRNLNVQQKEKKYGGIIHQLQLVDFWDNLGPHERSFIRNCTKWSFGGSIKGEDIDHPNSMATTKRDDCRFLLGNAAWAFDSKEYYLAESLLIEVTHRSKCLFTLHRAYQKLIHIYEVSADENKCHLQKWKSYCEEHIKLAPALFDESIKKEETPPEIRSFYILKNILLDIHDVEGFKSIVLLEQQYNNGNFIVEGMH